MEASRFSCEELGAPWTSPSAKLRHLKLSPLDIRIVDCGLIVLDEQLLVLVAAYVKNRSGICLNVIVPQANPTVRSLCHKRSVVV